MKTTEQLSISSNGSKQLINTIFKPLSQLDKTLPTRIIEYILHGYELDVLVDFDKLCQISNNAVKLYELLERPAEFHCSRYNYSSINYGIHWLLKARNNFYKSWTDTYTPEQIIRYARVLATLFDHLHFIKHVSEQIPSWLIYLLYDGLITTLPSYSENKDKIEERENWSIQQLHQFLEIEQAGLGEKLLFVIFDRQNIAVDGCQFFQYFTRLNGLLSYIQERIELFKQLPSLGLALLGQIEQLKYIQRYPELQLQLADFITIQALNTSKQVSRLATKILLNLPLELVQPQLQYFLTSGSAKERANATILLSRIISEPTILQQALANENNKKVITAIESALSRLESANSVKQQTNLVIPDFQPFTDTELPINARDILLQNIEEYIIKYEKLMQNELEENKKNRTNQDYYQKNYKSLKKIKSHFLDDIVAYLNGKIEYSTLRTHFDRDTNFKFLLTKNRLQSLPEFTLFHLFRIYRLKYRFQYNLDGKSNSYSLDASYFLERIYKKYDFMKKLDLRQIVDVIVKIESNENVKYTVAELFLHNDTYHDLYIDEPHKLWAFFAENEFLLDEAFGFTPLSNDWYNSHNRDKRNNADWYSVDVTSAIKTLQFFPIIPAKYVTYLCELALEGSKSICYVAQDALKLIPNIHNQIEPSLSSAKQNVRIAAANWLADLGQTSSIEALHVALKKEKREAVQAAILIALQKIGEDISQYLTSKKLLADAQKGLKGKKPAELDWFNFDLMPSLAWQNGDEVNSQIIEWWVWLAVKLKDPSNSLLTIYSRLLSQSSQQKLGEFILQSFIKQDTRTATIEEAEVKANLLAPQRFQEYKGYYKRYPEYYANYANITYEQVFEEIKNETLSTYYGSAIKVKGILALSSNVDGRVAVALLASYMKDHYRRRAQIEALLEALGNSDDPLIIQLLLSLARRYRTTSIQEKARLLVENIAQRNSWTTDQLADRTISTAGLDDDGQLILDYGERTFIASLDDKFKWQLKNADGVKIKALPEARKTEDADLVKEAKNQFKNSKKELSQLLDMQVSRFYEAMCTQRQWSIEDWQKYLQSHPIVGRLIQRLVWLELDNDGQIVNSFRPTEDGSLINNQDNEIVLGSNHFITLAHCALMSNTDIAQWQSHIKDYKINQLVEQFTHKLPDISKMKNGVIDDHLGWMTDSFTIRGILTKLGYKRDVIEDAGWFEGYHKYFASIGIYINIEFSGSFVPEENIPAVLYTVYFTENSRYTDKAIALDKLPQVLLAEGYADYIAVANASSGFEPNWKEKLEW
ncbi:DUF4132 domain-containing protein [Gilliamella apicola]|nr:DUF4132 domain-containing protein [Gilliamella apicola]